MSPTTVIVCLWLIVTSVTICGSVNIEVIDPIRSTGDEIGLIFIPGAKLEGDQYRQVAQAIQRASDLRVWVALTGNYIQGMPSPIQLPGAINAAINALKHSGMRSSNYVGVGHSLGGISLRSCAKGPKLKAAVLMAAFVTRNYTSLMSFPVPVLTIAAELDGQTRITRMVEEYAKLQQDVRVSRESLHRTPVVCVKGANHGQFASGPMPPRVRQQNPQPEVTEEEVHDKVAEYVSSFLTGLFSNNVSQISHAHRELENYFVESGKIFQPLLDVKALHGSNNSTSCPFANMAQEYLAGEYSDRIEVKNKIRGRFGFIVSKPIISKVGNKIVINTTALVDKTSTVFDRPSPLQSPMGVNLKLKSKLAVKEALGLNVSDHELKPNCLALNELALRAALDRSTSEARDRYRLRGRPIIFEEDFMATNDILWGATTLKRWEDETGLHVQAVALTMSSIGSTYPDNFYCKLITPYRALEWVLIDSLKPY